MRSAQARHITAIAIFTSPPCRACGSRQQRVRAERAAQRDARELLSYADYAAAACCRRLFFFIFADCAVFTPLSDSLG